MRALGALGALFVVALAVLLAVPLDRDVLYGFQRNTTATAASSPITLADGLPYTRRNIRFDSHGTSCDAWLYTPRHATAMSTARFPVLIMAHGMGAQKELGLQRFAEAFARAGLAALVFDYRTFGGSDGEPRHWVSPRRHLEDWRAALGLVKAGGLGPEYDTNKVGLWGTSYSGGHVLVVASEQSPGSLAAVISMIPHLDGMAASKASVRRRGLISSLRLLTAGLQDRLRAHASWALHATIAWLHQTTAAGGGGRVTGVVRDLLRHALSPLLAVLGSDPLLAPVYLRAVGGDGDLALMQLSAEQLKVYYSKHPAVYEGGWRPYILARFTLETSSYSPIKAVPRVTAPVLFVSALRDELCPAELVHRAAGLLPGGSSNMSSSSQGEVLELDCTHFDAYLGEHLATATDAMVQFLRQHLHMAQEDAEVSTAWRRVPP